MHRVILSAAFTRQAKKLTRTHPHLKPKLKQILNYLLEDPNHPSLKLHKLAGTHNWSVSVTRDIRLIFHWDGQDIYCTRLGTHDQVY
jgi:mRNA-degrading endonuclease YafQ of YafQ-DinJ toxin-antitoxin module